MLSKRLEVIAMRQDATLAQLVEQLIRNQQVVGSNPTGGSRKSSKINESSEISTDIKSLTWADCPRTVRICQVRAFVIACLDHSAGN